MPWAYKVTELDMLQDHNKNTSSLCNITNNTLSYVTLLCLGMFVKRINVFYAMLGAVQVSRDQGGGSISNDHT